MTTYFKVVSLKGTKRVSAFTSQRHLDLNSQWLLEYKKDEWTYPKVEGSRIFVFNTLAQAEYYKKQVVDEGEIWECEVDGIAKIYPIRSIRHEEMNAYWERKKKKKSTVNYSIQVWEGSRSAKAVKLIKRVENV